VARGVICSVADIFQDPHSVERETLVARHDLEIGRSKGMTVTIRMPQMGETVAEGTILEWIKQIGEDVDEGEVLVEISTDKVDTEVPSPATGVLIEILVPAGTTVDVGTAIAVLSDVESVVDTTDDAPGDSEPIEADAPPEGTASAAHVLPNAERRAALSPVVRKLAAAYNIDLAMVPGSGDGGRIVRKDVEAFIEVRGKALFLAADTSSRAASATRPPAALSAAVFRPGDVQEISRLRSRIAGNMIQARQSAAHVWTSVEVDYERVTSVRAKHAQAFKAAEEYSLTYLPFIARATIDALGAYPVVNSLFDIEAGTHTFHRIVNLGIAVDLDQKGLVVVNIRGADSMTLRDLARSIRSMATDARDGNLGPDDITGFTFSISNPGPFGSFMSAPIIPVPTSAILSTDTVTKKPIVVELPDGSEAIATRHVGYLGLSWDHRVFDGSTAVLFLGRIKESVETWDWEQDLS